MTGECHLLRLPDELLSSILSFFLITPQAVDSYDPDLTKPNAHQAQLTCKRLYQVAQPILYQNLFLNLEPYDGDEEHRERRLYVTLKANPSLLGFCRELTLRKPFGYWCDANDEVIARHAEIAEDFGRELTQLRKLVFFDWRGSGREVLSRHLKAVLTHAKRVQTLEVRRRTMSGSTVDLRALISAINGALLGGTGSLRSLCVHNVSRDEPDQIQADLKTMKRTGSITDLDIEGFLYAPEILKLLLCWPKQLFRFSLSKVYRNDYAKMGDCTDWSLGTLSPMLRVHRNTLTHIRIAGLNRGGLSGFDVSDFPCLRVLDLSYQSTSNEFSEEQIRKLLAPNLKVFRWDFTLEDQQCNEGLECFSAPEQAWLEGLLREAVKAGVRLDKIIIQFWPCHLPYDLSVEELETFRYPWDRMEQISRESGVKVVYNKPTYTRSEFDEDITSRIAQHNRSNLINGNIDYDAE